VRIDLSPWKVENAGLKVLVHDDLPLLANEKNGAEDAFYFVLE